MRTITPNRITAFRIVLAITLPLLLLWKRSFGAELVVLFGFTLACVTDWWDGHLARKRGMTTSSGKIADPIADKILILGLMMTFCHFRLYGWEWIALILLREVTVTATRIYYLVKGRAIQAEWAGKLKVGFQIGSIYATLLFLMAYDAGIGDVQLVRALKDLHWGLILVANAITVFSGALFFSKLRHYEK